MATFASRLKELREEKGLTQEQLSVRLNVGRSAVGMYEAGKRVPRFETIDKFADFFDVSPDYMRGKVDNKHEWLLTPEEQAEMFEKVKAAALKEGKSLPPGVESLPDLCNWVDFERMKEIMKSQRNYIRTLEKQNSDFRENRAAVRIPVLGRVVAGIPLEAITDIIDYEEIPPSMARTGKFFALQVRGKSMEPTLRNGDVVIVRQQPNVENGEIAIVLVNGDEATVKEVKESPAGITLIGHNVAVYTPHFYTRDQIESLPITILGKVVELRRKF